MRIVGLDPGGTTGWTICEAGTTKAVWISGEIAQPQHHAALRYFLDDSATDVHGANQVSADLIICEGFDNRANPAAELISLEYIGVVKEFCQANLISCYLPSPSDKTWCDDKKLKALGLYQPARKHSNDAKRHVVKYLATKRKYGPILEQLRGALNA